MQLFSRRRHGAGLSALARLRLAERFLYGLLTDHYDRGPHVYQRADSELLRQAPRRAQAQGLGQHSGCHRGRNTAHRLSTRQLHQRRIHPPAPTLRDRRHRPLVQGAGARRMLQAAARREGIPPVRRRSPRPVPLRVVQSPERRPLLRMGRRDVPLRLHRLPRLLQDTLQPRRELRAGSSHTA